MRFFLTFSLFTLLLFSFQVQAENLVKEDAREYREEGFRLQAMGDLDAAAAYYEKAAQMDPHFAEVYNDLGVIYETRGNDDKALAMYKKAIEIDPRLLSTYTNLAFVYERKGDVKNATFYWKKRYEAGQKGDYWHEVAKQHLVKLGTYPEVRKTIMEEKAAKLTKEMLYQRKQESLATLDEAQAHFDIGNQAFHEKDYEAARKEFRTVLSLNPPDEGLKNKTIDLYQETERLYLRDQAYVNAGKALDYMDRGDYIAASDKLKQSLKAIFHITQEK
jgi:Flp pilus assembly protein TadD